MNLGAISIDSLILKELIELTGAKTPATALDIAIRFTILHEKDNILEALK